MTHLAAMATAADHMLGLFAAAAFVCGLLYLLVCIPPVRAWLNREPANPYLDPWHDREPGELPEVEK